MVSLSALTPHRAPALSGKRSRRRQLSRSLRRSGGCVAQKMYVPSDSFGGKSPERKAADALCNLFTFVAARVVQAQLQPTGSGGFASYNTTQYIDLMHHLQEHPIKDGNEWLTTLMRKNQMLAVRIMEVRKAYSADDFEWEMCKLMANDKLNAGNAKLMQTFALETFEKAARSTEAPS